MADQLQKVRVIADPEYGYENVYEWVEASLCAYPAKLNLARKHYEGLVPPDTPLVFGIFASRNWLENLKLDGWTTEIAQQIHDKLHIDVEIGRAAFEADDKFSYQVERSLHGNL